jgi:hypothetical protein
MDLPALESFAEQALALVAKAAPLATIGGPEAGAIGGMVGQVAETLDLLITNASGDAAIIAGGDLTKIRALQAQLQAENAELASQIAAS